MNMYAFVVGLLISSVACGRGEQAGGTPAKSAAGMRDTEIVHEACTGDGPREDANSDGKVDIQHVNKDGREVCRSADVDFDGKVDQFTFYDASGEVRRRETDLDGNGVPNMVDHFQQGKLVLRELDTANQGKFDTWEVFDAATGKRTRRERDGNGDGRVDQWWTWQGEQILIASDKDGDGQPDPDSELVWGNNGLVPVAAASASAPGVVPPAPSAPVAPSAAPVPAAASATTPAPAATSSSSDAAPKRTKR
jgi:hypothetical protein